MDRQLLNHALAKLRVGDSITDSELSELVKFYTRLEADLGSLSRHRDPGFGLAYSSVLRDLQTVTSFQDARKRHKKSGF